MVREITVITITVVLYFISLSSIGHGKFAYLMPAVVLILALLKVIYFLKATFKRLSEINQIEFNDLVSRFGAIIVIIIISFALDYTCLSYCSTESFRGVDADLSFISRLFEFTYFSVVTFATIGYGDIIPATISSKFLVLLEIIFSLS